MAKKKTGQKTFHSDEEKVCGQHASRQAFLRRPNKLAKVFVEQAKINLYGEILKFCAKNKIGYKSVDSNELKKVSGSEHHEGICLCFKKQEPLELENELRRLERKEKAMILVLHEAQNPHNIGAILRVAAHFGVDLIILESKSKSLSASSYRIAEGGAEYVPYVFVESVKDELAGLKKMGFEVFATSSHRDGNLYKTQFPKKSVIIMGREDSGLPQDILSQGKLVSIPGTGYVESLNLSSATSILLSEFRRQNPI